MFRLSLIALLAFGAWMYFTEAGHFFYQEHFTPKKPAVAVDARALQHAQADLTSIQLKLSNARSELARREDDDRRAAAQGTRMLFATDKELLKRSIDRLIQEEARLQRSVEAIMAGKQPAN